MSPDPELAPADISTVDPFEDTELLLLNGDGSNTQRVLQALQNALKKRMHDQIGDAQTESLPDISSAHWAVESKQKVSVTAQEMRNKLLMLHRALVSSPRDKKRTLVVDTDLDNAWSVYSQIRPIFAANIPKGASENVSFDFILMQDALTKALEAPINEISREILDKVLNDPRESIEEPDAEILVLGRSEKVTAITPFLHGYAPRIRYSSSIEGDTEELEGLLDQMNIDQGLERHQWDAFHLRGKVEHIIKCQKKPPRIVLLLDSEFSEIASVLAKKNPSIKVIDATESYADLMAERLLTDPGSDTSSKTEHQLAIDQIIEIEKQLDEKKNGLRKVMENARAILTPANWLKRESWVKVYEELTNVNGIVGQVAITAVSVTSTLGALTTNTLSLEAALAFAGILLGAFAVAAVATFLIPHRDSDTATEALPEKILTYSPPMVMGIAIASLMQAGAPIPYLLGAGLTQAMLVSYYRISVLSRLAQDAITAAFTQLASKMPGLALLVAKLKTPRAGRDVKNPADADRLQREVITGASVDAILGGILETFVKTLRAKGHSTLTANESNSFDDWTRKVITAAAAETPYLETLLDHEPGSDDNKNTAPKRKVGLRNK